MVLLLLGAILAAGCGQNTTINQSADNPPNAENPQGRPGRQFRQQDPEELKGQLAGLVKDGTITQKQADSVVTYWTKQAADRMNRRQAGASASSDERSNMSPEERRSQWAANQEQGQGPSPGDNQGQGQRRPRGANQGQRPNLLSELVKNGTITQEQADKISAVMFRPRGAGPTN